MDGVWNSSGYKSLAGFSIIQATILKIKAVGSSETRVTVRKTERCQEREYRSLNIRYRENLNHPLARCNSTKCTSRLV
jgi:hypothetical protein